MDLSRLPRPLASYVDHTLLKPDATEAQVARLLAEAAEAGFAAAMVPPCWVARAARDLAGTAVAPATVIAFPLGYAEPAVRVAESVRAVTDGARELDTVLNLSWLKGGDDARAGDDLAGWVDAVRRLDPALVLKVIVETALLSDDEKRRAARLAAAAGADFVKTSTGFGPGGATVPDVRLLNEAVAGTPTRVKASGGIRDLQTALAMIAAGAERLGTSSGVAILAEAGMAQSAAQQHSARGWSRDDIYAERLERNGTRGSEAMTESVSDLIYCGTQPPVDAEGTQQLLVGHSAVWCPPPRLPFTPTAGDRLWLVWRPQNATEVRLLGGGVVAATDQGNVLWRETALPGVRHAAQTLGYGGPTNMAFLHLANVFVQEDRPLVDLGDIPAGLSHANEHQFQILSAIRDA